MLIDRRKRINDAWERVYEKIDSIPFLPWVNTALPKYLLDGLVDKIGDKKTIRILDYGCGTGRLGKYIADTYSYCDVYYYDVSYNALNYCIEYENINVNKVIFPTKEPEKMFNDNEFDGVICWGIFHHIDPEDWREYRNQLFNIVKPGGILLFGDFTQEDDLFKSDGKRISETTKIESYAVSILELFVEKFYIEEKGIFPFIENMTNRNRIISYIIGRKRC